MRNRVPEERGSVAVLGSSETAIAEPPRSALPAFAEEMEATRRLKRVRTLLDEALVDLAGRGTLAPCSHVKDLLTEAFSELKAFSLLVNDPLLDRASLVRDLRTVLPRLTTAQRLLAAASEFYREWCAAGLAPSQPAPGYEADCLAHGPALLAFEA